MKLLAIECTAKPASVALSEDGKIVCEFYSNVGLTHSETLMPMADAALKAAGWTLKDVDGFCIAAGPGSFTGVRIGMSALKGMALGLSKPVVGVSSLKAMAYGCISHEGLIVSCMDARCGQCYCGLYLSDGEKISEILGGMALSMDELCGKIAEELTKLDKKAVVVGDGAALFMEKHGAQFGGRVFLSHPNCRFQSARGVAAVAYPEFLNGNTQSSEEILPIYLRLPQAERELKKRTKP